MLETFDQILTSVCYKGTEETIEDIVVEGQQRSLEYQITELLIKQELGVLV